MFRARDVNRDESIDSDRTEVAHGRRRVGIVKRTRGAVTVLGSIVVQQVQDTVVVEAACVITGTNRSTWYFVSSISA